MNSTRRSARLINSCRALRSTVDRLKGELSELKNSMATCQQPMKVVDPLP